MTEEKKRQAYDFTWKGLDVAYDECEILAGDVATGRTAPVGVSIVAISDPEELIEFLQEELSERLWEACRDYVSYQDDLAKDRGWL